MTDKGFVPGIQGLRGMAALSVLMVHLYVMPLLAGFLPPVPQWIQEIINMGGHGVELFFMISGFLIPASLVRHGSVSRFFHDRFMRIMPVFVILHLALFTLGPIVGYKFFAGIDVPTYIELFLANLFFLPDALGLPIGQQNAWTLAYEWAFYIWFAVTFVVAVKQRNWVLGAPLLALGLAGVAYRPIAAYFAIGMLCSAVQFRFKVPGRTGLMAAALCAVAMYVSLEYINPFLGLLPGFLLFGMVLASGSGPAAALSGPVPQFLGKISYSLYLIHPFALFPLQMLGARLAAHGVNLWILWGAFICLGLVVALASGTLGYEIIEVRLRRLIDNALRQAALPPIEGVGRQIRP